MDDWRSAALYQHESSRYGFLGKIPGPEVLLSVNQNRQELGLRSVELRNKLLAVERETGLNLYLPKGWQKAEITIATK